ncbi:MAG: 3-phosphoglycerate dehydrogenase family protein [Cyclobacteriaceae bacterium]
MDFSIRTFNKISPTGLNRFDPSKYAVGEDVNNPDAVLVRSASLHDYSINGNLKAIARAGAGVNNIPIDACTAKGVVVFNTPGANANAVKELVLSGLLLSSRKIYEGIHWVQSLRDSGEDIGKLVEKNKSSFAGPELYGKTLGVVGLGAIGMLVANAAESLGMKVIGFDPYISIHSAWQLSRYVQRAEKLEEVLTNADYISLHMPLNDKTSGFLDAEKIAIMKPGVSILNFARGGLVERESLLKNIETGHIRYFVTDFPEADLLGYDQVITIPHLGASTPESEDNCATMAADQLIDYLENGNIRNSVNFPTATMPRNGGSRIIIGNKNIPGYVSKITSKLADQNINIADMLNQHHGDIAFNIIDLDSPISHQEISDINQMEGIFLVRLIPPNN